MRTLGLRDSMSVQGRVSLLDCDQSFDKYYITQCLFLVSTGDAIFLFACVLDA
jgi:hypothetical protein